MGEKETEKKVAKPIEKWVVGEVPTETKPFVIDATKEKPEEQVHSIEQALVMILNNQEKIMKALI